MNTSYFANLKNVENPLSISGKAPEWYKGPQFKLLAPKYSFFKDYKDGKIDEAGYTEKFHELVLAPLNVSLVWNTLMEKHGHDVTLLCYEKPGDFCHRRIVAKWFEDYVGFEIPEASNKAR